MNLRNSRQLSSFAATEIAQKSYASAPQMNGANIEICLMNTIFFNPDEKRKRLVYNSLRVGT